MTGVVSIVDGSHEAGVRCLKVDQVVSAGNEHSISIDDIYGSLGNVVPTICDPLTIGRQDYFCGRAGGAQFAYGHDPAAVRSDRFDRPGGETHFPIAR